MAAENEAAYQIAKHLIAEAKANKATTLSLDRDDIHALDVLPHEISDLRWLVNLSLDHTQVRYLAPVAALTRLRSLSLGDTQVSDLTPLASLRALETLSLDSTQVSDLAPLASLTRLSTLFVSRSRVSDLTPLAALTGLTALWSIDIQVSDLTPLAALTGLTGLWLDSTQVSDLAPLMNLPRLTDLSFNGTQVSDLTPLASITGLTDLMLVDTEVSNLAPLATLTGLKSLSFDHTQVSDLTPLASLTELKDLTLSGTQVSDLAPLVSLTGLTKLSVINTRVSDLTPLAGLTGLTLLWVGNTQVSDLTPLAGLTGLDSLWLDSTKVSDLRPLRGLSKLRSLDDSENSVGLTFRNTVATQIDPRIAEIAEIPNLRIRAQTLFDYLENWEPPAQPPGQRSAPIMVEFDQGGRLVESHVTTNLSPEVERRARGGWEALKEVHTDAIETLGPSNLPNLERAMARFGRALGDNFEQMRPIPLGTHGQRIVEISKDARDVLIDDAAGDLIAFAAAIQTYLQRFPEWIEYLRDTAEDTDEGPPLQSVAPQLEAVSQALKNADFVAPEIPSKLDDLIDAAKDTDLPAPLVRRGTLRSISNIFSTVAEWLLSSTQRVAKDFGKKAYDRGIEAAVGTTGTALSLAALDIFKNNSQILLGLAKTYPQHLGWMEAVLRNLGLI